MKPWGSLFLCVGFGLLAAGCPKGNADFNQGRKAETLQDFDAALGFYQKALKADPYNANYKIKLNQTRFEAGQAHIKQGVALRKKGDLQGSAGEFQRAQAIDPSSPVAEQELRKTVELIAEKNRETEAAAEPPADSGQPPLAILPPEIKPLSRAPINLKMSNDSKIVFDTVGKLAGLTVIYDPDFPARRITVELTNVTLEQAMDIVSMQSKSVWKPVTENIIFVFPDQPQKRRDYEEQVIKTFYLSNTVQPQDLTEIVTGLRQLLDLKRIQQLNSQNAIIVRDTPDKLLLAGKMISDIDKAKPEVVVQIEVLQARTDRLRDLGVLPGQQATVAFTPGGTTTTSGSTTTTTPLTLNNLKHLSTKDYSVTLPGATANAVLTDTFTKIIQNPEIRLKEGESNVLGGLFERTDTKTLNGWPGLAKIPFLRYLFSDEKTDHQENEVLIVLIPRIVRMPEWTKANLRSMYSGSETNVQVKRESDIRAPSATPPPAPAQQPQMNQNPAATSPNVSGAAPASGAAPQTTAAKIRFEPQSLSLKAGQTATIGVVVENVNDLFSIPLLLQYNPAVISVEEVQHGGFLSGGTQEIAIVQRVDKEHGQAIISATRQPNTPGVNGSGTLIGIVIKALAPGSSNLSIVQVNAKDSQQKLIPLVTSEATLQVQP